MAQICYNVLYRHRIEHDINNDIMGMHMRMRIDLPAGEVLTLNNYGIVLKGNHSRGLGFYFLKVQSFFCV